MDTTDPEKIGPKPADVDGTTMLQLLNDCSGVFQPGILTALVGSSGAGKTTLMDVLAGRKTGAAPPLCCAACLNSPSESPEGFQFQCLIACHETVIFEQPRLNLQVHYSQPSSPNPC